MNRGLVFQPVELRCLSDKLSAVNIEGRCGGEQVGGLGGCSGGEAGGGRGDPGGGSCRLGAARSSSYPFPSLMCFPLLTAKLKPFSLPQIPLGGT